MSRLLGTLGRVAVAGLASLVAWPTVSADESRGKSSATITASFADSCRDFAAHSSKDISHVEVHYVDGRVVKDEGIRGDAYALDGGAGDEIEIAVVKSGTTSEEFECSPANHAPIVRLEILTPPVDQTAEHCSDFFAGGLICEQSSPRSAWTGRGQIPDAGGSESGLLHWGCGAQGDPALCSMTIRFRGTGSTDPDGDLASWSLDFGDGTSASGSWSTSPPTEIVHEYPRVGSSLDCGGSTMCAVTLTVTDFAGQSRSETIVMVSVDQTPD